MTSDYFMRILKFSPEFKDIQIGSLSFMGERICCPWTDPHSKASALCQIFSKENATYLF